ncbi:MAG: acetyl-CoA acetyltransferase [Ilumatobacteraceae bacterium]
MSLDPRTPVIVGAGQFLHRADGLDDALEPAALMTEAIDAASRDAGLDGVPELDSLRVVGLLSWRYGNPAWAVAERLDQRPRQLAMSTMGGNSPQTLLNRTCLDIESGDLGLAVLTGGEAWRTRMRAKRSDTTLDWPKAPADAEPDVIGHDLDMNLQAEIDRGIYMPVQVYPMFETAVRASLGTAPDEHIGRVSEMWARFSATAADNPHAWIREPLSAEEIRTPGPRNRMIGYPYTKVMNSNNDVDMAAALMVCSVEVARRLGVPEDRWVFPRSGTDCHEHPHVSHRDTFAATPAIERGGRLALELAGATIDDVALVDLYSCFPSAVQLGARSLGLDPFDPDRPLTLTGGLSFAGGPWNNYVMHAIATMVDRLRERPGETGLVWANGGYCTKHSFGVYGTEPPADGFRHADPQAEIDALPRRELAGPAAAAGPATIEAYTVMHGRDGEPERAIAACLLADGRRAWGTSDDPDVRTALLTGEWVGTAVTLTPDGTLQP